MTSVYQREKSSLWSVRSSTNCFGSWTSLTRAPRLKGAAAARMRPRGKARSIARPPGRGPCGRRSARGRRAHDRVEHRLRLELQHAAEVTLRAACAAVERAWLARFAAAQHDVPLTRRREPQLRRRAAEHRH